MAETINFPFSYQAYIKKGREALAEGRLSEAEDYLATAYQTHPCEESHYLYFLTLMAGGYAQEAVDLSEDMPEVYQGDLTKSSAYVDALIQSGQFAKAGQVIQEALNQADEEEVPIWQEKIEELNQAESQAIADKQARQADLEKELYQLADHGPMDPNWLG